MPKQKTNQLRIIGGRFRGRKISFPNVEGLRPTPDRIRETVFNWMQTEILNAVCLDLFCGSGALSFEALSRGAQSVTAIDSDASAVKCIQHTADELALINLTVLKKQIPCPLDLPKNSVDIIFLDPPFRKNLTPDCLNWITQSNILKPGGFLYLETERNLDFEYALKFERHWYIEKQKTTGQVCYRLLKFRK